MYWNEHNIAYLLFSSLSSPSACFSPSDPTLTVENVTEVMGEVAVLPDSNAIDSLQRSKFNPKFPWNSHTDSLAFPWFNNQHVFHLGAEKYKWEVEVKQSGRVRMLVVSSVQKANDFASLATNFLYVRWPLQTGGHKNTKVLEGWDSFKCSAIEMKRCNGKTTSPFPWN